MSFTIEVNFKEIIEDFYRIEKRVENLNPVMKRIGLYMIQRTKKRFSESGPGWPPLSPVTIARRRGKRPKPLWDTGRLMSSIGILVTTKREVRVGTNVIYAAVQQFGAKKGSFGEKEVTVKEHTRTRKGKKTVVREHTRKQSIPWGDIPARPFLYVEDRDVDVFKEIILRYLMEGQGE